MAELLSYPLSEQGVRDALTALGTTVPAVYRNLLAMGIQGKRESACDCPVANYLKRVVEAVEHVSVDHYDVRVDGPDNQVVKADLPSPVKGFIEWFDLGSSFPELEVSDGSS